MTYLERMSVEEFSAFNEINIKLLADSYGKQLSENDALKKAAEEQAELLPDGCETSGQFLFAVKNSDIHDNTYPEEDTAGGLWFTAIERGGSRFAFLFFIHISPALRGRGIGSETMKLLEQEVLSLNLNEIRLHVLKNNTSALRVYKKTGYSLFTDYEKYNENAPGIIMRKLLKRRN